MKAQEGAAAPTSQEDGASSTPLGELDEKTERVDADVVEPSHAYSDRASDGADSFASRQRRATVISSIPAQLAKSMGEVRDPSAPTARLRPEITRRVEKIAPARLPPPGPAAKAVPAPPSQPSPPSPSSAAAPAAAPTPIAAPAPANEEALETYSVELIEELSLPPREQVEALIELARSTMERGNLGGAVIAADQALAEAGKVADVDVAELIKLARPLFDRIFAAYVGLLGQVPVRARSDEQIAGQELGDRTRLLLKGVDGVQTLEQLARSTEMPPVEAMGIAASLLAAGIIRIL